MNNKYFLYRHIRLDKNEVFYIGIGTKPNRTHPHERSEYRRAYDKRNRCDFWKRITSKTNYSIEIMLESDNYEFIKQKEIEFIRLYGRKNLGTGTLVNLTDGGEGNLNVVRSEEWRRNISMKAKGRKLSQELIDRMVKARAWYPGHSQETRDKISKAQKGRKKSPEHLQKLYAGQIVANSKHILQYDINGNFIKEWRSAVEVYREININACAIRACVRGIANHAGHFVWREKETDDISLHIEPTPKMIALSKHWDTKERLSKGININNKNTILLDTLDKKEISFDTRKDAARFLNMNPANFNRDIKKNSLLRNRYKLVN